MVVYYPETIIKNNLKRITYLGIQFNFYYTPEYSLSPIVADIFIPEVFNYIYSNNSNIISLDSFKGYIFHIWNNTRKDVPYCVQNKVYNIDHKLKVVHLNLSRVPKDNIVFDLRDIVSKIFGYMFAYYIGFENKSYMKNQWLKLRGYICKNPYSLLELFVEDFKVLFGQSRGYYSIQNFNEENFHLDSFNIAKNVFGLRDLIKIWKPVSDYFVFNKNKCLIVNKQILLSSTNKDYFGILFLKKEFKDFFKKPFKIYKIDSTDIYFFDCTSSNWIKTKE